jgi:hypothetical protein
MEAQHERQRHQVVLPQGAVDQILGRRLEHVPAARKGSRRNLRFIGKDLILESDNADLIHDVSCNIDRAQVKLRLISKRLAGLKRQSAVEIEKLAAAEIKLRAAIVAAQEKKAKPPAQKQAAAPRKEGTSAVDFLRSFRESIARAMKGGKDVWQVLDEMEEGVLRARPGSEEPA